MTPPESAIQRLARNRSEVRLWLEQDDSRRDAFAHSGLGQLTSLPWIRRISDHPLASLALGAVAKWWMKPRAASSPATGLLAIGTGWSLLRRRPLLTLSTVAVIGVVAWWTQRRRSLPHHP